MSDIMQEIYEIGIVPVVVLKNVKDAVPTAEALAKGGITAMEITMRTDAALDCIREVSSKCPDILVGAGTVITLDQCKAAIEAGAKFIVSPGTNKALIEYCISIGMPVLPGAVTPTEIMIGLELGLKVFKFFPADVYGGLKGMKALKGPFGNIKFLPTGGVSGDNLQDYIKEPYIHAVGGSWVCKAADIEAGNWDKITELAAKATAVKKECR